MDWQRIFAEAIERLRFTPGPAHTAEIMRDLAAALVEIWDRLEMRRAA